MSLMLINPRSRKGKGRRSAAQRAATKRLVAFNRSKRRTNPAKRRAHRAKRRTNPVGLARVHHRARSRVRHRARRHNPSLRGMLSGGGVGGLVMAGFKGAVGSVAVNAIASFLPDTVKTGKLLYVTRAGIAILIGTVGKKVLGQHARAMAEGALAVNFADLINSMAGGMLPGSQLHGADGEMGEFLSGTHMAYGLPDAGGRGYGSHLDTELHGVGEYVS